MAEKPNPNLIEAFTNERPAKPALSSADKRYLRGLRRQGYTQTEIEQIGKKSGFDVPADLFTSKKKTTP